MNLKVPDFTISVYSRFIYYLLYGVVSEPSPSIYWHPQGMMKYQEIFRERNEERMRPKRRELHEMPSTEMVQNIRLTCSVVDPDPNGSGTFAWIRIQNKSSGSGSSKK